MRSLLIFCLCLMTYYNSSLFAQNYPQDFASLDSLWLEYEAAYDFEQALPYAIRTVEAAKRAFGDTDSIYLEVLNSLVVLKIALSLDTEAIEHAKEVVAHCKSIESREGQLAYATALSNLATAQMELDEFEEGILLLEESLNIQAALLGKENLDYSTTLANLAQNYIHLGRREEGITLQEEALRIERQFLDPDDEELLISLDNLAVSAAEIEQNAKAEQVYKEILSIWEEYGKELSPTYAVIFNNMAYFFEEQGKLEQAEQYYQLSVDMQKELVGTEHPSYAFSLANLVVFQTLQKQNYAASVPVYQRIVKIYKNSLGVQHPDYIRAVGNLSALYLDLEAYDKSLGLAHEAICQFARVSPQKDTFAQVLALVEEGSFQNFSEAINLFLMMADIYGKRYDAHQLSGDLEKQKVLLQALMAYVDRIQQSFANDEDKLAVLKSVTEVAALSLENLSKQQDLEFGQALALMEKNKSALLTGSITKSKHGANHLPQTISDQEQSLKQELKTLQAALAQARGNKNQQEVEALQLALVEQYKKQELFLKKLQKEYPTMQP